MKIRHELLPILLASLTLLPFAACGGGGTDTGSDGAPGSEADANPSDPDGGAIDTGCNPVADEDNDSINNGLEGCELVPARDSDDDGMPDFQDADSDNDGVDDNFEDRNGDGVVGTCTTACSDGDDCASGDACSGSGVCVGWLCLDGETDPHFGDTDGNGTPDGQEGTRVCNPPSEDNLNGLKPFRTVDSASAIDYAEPNWRIAIEVEAVDGKVDIDSPEDTTSAYVIDLSEHEVAGFLVSRTATTADLGAVRASMVAIQQLGPFAIAGVNASVLRTSGLRGTSLDGYDTVLSTQVQLTSTSTDVTVLRDKVIAALLQRPSSDVTIPPVGWTGTNDTQFVVVFQSVYRPSENQVLYMGAVVRLADFIDLSSVTAFHADDLANGTGLTVSGNGEAAACEPFRITDRPKADMIWVFDTSGSMDDDRDNVAGATTLMFDKASTAGLDFRMGVTDMNIPRAGKFASRDATSSTGDRWLGPEDAATFQTNVMTPSGPDSDGGEEYGLTQAQSAITRHGPRDDDDPAMIREDSQLVVVIVSDEHAQELEDEGIFGDQDEPATPEQLSDALTFMKPFFDTFEDYKAKVHVIGVPAPYPSCSDSGEVAWGYLDLASWFGGQFGSICQSDLTPTLEAIIDDVLGSSSEIVLQYVPISATLSVTRNGVAIPRSREEGWDFYAATNSIILNNLPFDSETPTDLVVSYRRWSEQIPIE